MAATELSSSLLDAVPVGLVANEVIHAVEDVTINVGDVFPNMKQFRSKLGLYGITHKCPYRARRSDNSRFVGLCPTVMTALKRDPKKAGANVDPATGVPDLGAEQCPFNIIARRRKEGGVCVTRAVMQHAPGCKAPVTFSTSATSAYMTQLMEDSTSTIAPREIGKFVHRATGTKLSYSTLWRTSHMLASKERERQDATFRKIVPFLDAFREANPGTVAIVEQRSDAHFYRAFLFPGALMSAFSDCPFGLHVDAMPLTSFHEGRLLISYARDGLNGLLPLAIAIVPSDDEDNWRFFLHQLLVALPILGCPGLSITYEQSQGIESAISVVLPASRANATSIRTDWSTSGTLQEFYLQLSQLCANSYFMVIVGWITQVAVLMYARYVELEPERNMFPGAILGCVGVAGTGWEVVSFGPSDYLVVNAHEKHQVNLALRTCTCGEWYEHSFPCVHAIRCLPLERLVALGQFIHPSYFTESMRRCYSRRMTLIDPASVPSQSDTIDTSAFVRGQLGHGNSIMIAPAMPLLPPSAGETVKRGRGRPRIARSSASHRGAGLGAMYQCGHCHGKGHNSRTCPMVTKPELQVPQSPTTLNSGTENPIFDEAAVQFPLDSALTKPSV